MAIALQLLLTAYLAAGSETASPSPTLVSIGSYKLTLERFESYWELLPAARREACASATPAKAVSR